MRLKSVRVRNYRNIQDDIEIRLKDLAVMIGPNGSGKSNIIGLLEFFKTAVSGFGETTGAVTSFESAVESLGGNRILNKAVDPPARVMLSYRLVSPESRKEDIVFDLSLFIGMERGRITVAEESLYGSASANSPKRYFYHFHDPKPGEGIIEASVETVLDFSSLDETVLDGGLEGAQRFETLTGIPISSLGIFILPELLEKTNLPSGGISSVVIRRSLVEAARNWRFYNANHMDLGLIKHSEPKIGPKDIHLHPSGNNLALVLHNLIQRDVDFEDRLNQAARSFLPRTKRIRPVSAGLMNIVVEWHFEDAKEPFYLNELSDGTVRMLCWASLLLSPEPPSLLVIDEPELGIHAAWMPILAEWIKRASRDTQVIVSTHSPDLLDHFTEDHLGNVLCFSRPKRKGNDFTVKALSRKALANQLEEGWRLGDLYRVGDPGIGGWPW